MAALRSLSCVSLPVKTGKVRVVPIHPHSIAMGLMDYVEAVKARLGPKGPLYCRPQTQPSRKHLAVRRERLAEWVRKLGVVDPGINQITRGVTRSCGPGGDREEVSRRTRDFAFAWSKHQPSFDSLGR
jgi:hypothetical protein